MQRIVQFADCIRGNDEMMRSAVHSSFKHFYCGANADPRGRVV